jgi:hypothetical protein
MVIPPIKMSKLALLNLRMNRKKGPHPSPLSTGEGISLLGPLSLRRRGVRAIHPFIQQHLKTRLRFSLSS